MRSRTLPRAPSSRAPCSGRGPAPRPGQHPCPARAGSRRLQLRRGSGSRRGRRGRGGRPWIVTPATSSSGCSSNSAPWPCCSPKVGARRPAGWARARRAGPRGPGAPAARALLAAGEVASLAGPAGRDKLPVLRSRGGGFAAAPGCPGPDARRWSDSLRASGCQCLYRSARRELPIAAAGERGPSVGRRRPGGTADPAPVAQCPRVRVSVVSVCLGGLRGSVFECVSAASACVYCSVSVRECVCVFERGCL